jgi:sigma-E factor negative regulatory protein RseC
MDEIGVVTAAEGDILTVRMKRSAACARCGVCLPVANTNFVQLEVKNECLAEINDRVYIEFKPGALLKAAAVLYGLPLVGFLTGCVLGTFASRRMGADGMEALAAFLTGLALAGLIYWFIKRSEPALNTKKHSPAAVKKVKKI